VGSDRVVVPAPRLDGPAAILDAAVSVHGSRAEVLVALSGQARDERAHAATDDGLERVLQPQFAAVEGLALREQVARRRRARRPQSESYRRDGVLARGRRRA
jgi:hypothetical protein